MNYFLQVADLVSQKILSLTPDLKSDDFDRQKIRHLLEVPKDASMGDIAFPCFALAKILRKGPPQIAKSLAEEMGKEVGCLDAIAQVIAAGPYLNFVIDRTHLAGNLINDILEGSYLGNRSSQKQKVMVEYSQPNTHKAFHVGHMRNVALGDAISRICAWGGYDVLPVNYFGDVGTHVAKCLWFYKEYFKGDVPKHKRGEFLGELYVKANEMMDFTLLTQAPFPGVMTACVKKIKKHPQNEKWQLVTVSTFGESSLEKTVVCGGVGFKIADVVAYVPVGERFAGREVLKTEKKGVFSEGLICSQKELALGEDKNKIYVFPQGTQEGQPISEVLKIQGALEDGVSVLEEMKRREKGVGDTLKALESGDPETVALWKRTRQWSLDEFKQIYSWLDVCFTHDFYESDVGDQGKKIVMDYYKKGVLVKSEGAIGADLSAYKLPFFLLLKSNGTGLYSTKDIALAQMKFDKFKVDKSVYVVDSAQSLHFQQAFKALELMGYEKAKDCYHLSYGMVERPDGKMSSRKGNIILFSELKALLLKKIREDFLCKYENGKSEEKWSEKEITNTAHKIAVATIKYGMLNQDNNKNIVFDLNEWTAQTGNTGPYMMYAYARTRSILRDLGEINKGLIDWSLLVDESESLVLRKLMLFEDTAKKAGERYEPQLLCIYLYGLSKDYSRMYKQCSVLKAKSEALKHTRGALIQSVGKVLSKGLELIGIETVERM